MTLSRVAWVTVGLFGAGVAIGIAAERRGIPQDQVPRWLVKGVLKRGLRVYDALIETAEAPAELA